MHLDLEVLQLVIGVAIPLATGLITKYGASSRLKALATLTLSAIAGVAQSALDSNGALSREALGAAVVTYVVAIASYYGVWKPTGTAETLNSATAGFGLGAGDSATPKVATFEVED